ncbi:pilin glycosylation protein PglB [Neisseria animaloris]|uniref:acetyltransferase n=1 Tax=Neisseria animaloris TaxID=326522 RepID=UPI000F71F6B2|nr:acetyltransferase [Neisseria animaloris]VEH88051.1 pilin glycosylation protein PglB [Neisseria animaloris]
MNNKLAVIGAGGHAKVILDAALLMEKWETVVFLDDYHNGKKTEFMGFPLLGGCGLLGQTVTPDQYDVALAIGDNATRKRRFEEVEKMGFHLPVITHPSAVVSRFAKVEHGTVIFAQAVVGAGAHIGKGVIINNSATVDHDCRLGDFVHISPGSHLAGNTSIDELSWIGIGSCTRQNSKVGKNCIIGAGAAVIENIPDNETAFGIPAQKLTR